MCKVSRGSEDHLVQGLADFGSFSQKMPLNILALGLAVMARSVGGPIFKNSGSAPDKDLT